MRDELRLFGIKIDGSDDPPFLEFAATDAAGALDQYAACFSGKGGLKRDGDSVDLGNGKTAIAVEIPPVE
jgi:hypothetical protein